MKRPFIVLGTVALFLLAFFNVGKLKNCFIASPLAKIYVETFRDGSLVDENHLVTHLDNGMKIIVNKHDACVCWFVRLTGHWDSNEKEVLRKIVKKDFRVVEVGANFGVNTLFMADLVGKNGKVYAFEANPNISKYLIQSVGMNALNDRITVFEMAASNEAYKGWMVYASLNLGGGYILPKGHKCQKNDLCAPIEVNKLDNVITGEPIDLLKIDAEGAELWILEGAKKLLAQPDILLMMEHCPSHLKRNNIEVDHLLSLLKQSGFAFVYSIGKKGALTPLAFEDLRADQNYDIVLAKHSLQR